MILWGTPALLPLAILNFETSKGILFSGPSGVWFERLGGGGVGKPDGVEIYCDV